MKWTAINDNSTYFETLATLHVVGSRPNEMPVAVLGAERTAIRISPITDSTQAQDEHEPPEQTLTAATALEGFRQAGLASGFEIFFTPTPTHQQYAYGDFRTHQ